MLSPPPSIDLIHVVMGAPEVLGNGGVVVGQVMRVEDDALAVDLGIAHAERQAKLNSEQAMGSVRLTGVYKARQPRNHLFFEDVDEADLL